MIELRKKTKLTQQRIQQITNNIEIDKICNSIKEWTDKGKTVEEAAKKLEI